METKRSYERHPAKWITFRTLLPYIAYT